MKGVAGVPPEETLFLSRRHFAVRARVSLVALSVLFFSLQATAADPYVRARVEVPPGPEAVSLLAGRDLDVVGATPEGITVVGRASVVEALRTEGVPVVVEVPDLEAYYARRFAGYRQGFGPFHTYSETVDFLFQLHADYPEITSEPISIGQSWQGNDIWAIKISDNPELEEDEPEVLFDGLHHAREPMTVEVLLGTMTYLCENYGQDPLVTFLVDNRQTWFVPIVNPDGYLYNELTNPGGGGLWRKNRRDNGTCWGVDLNRNYPLAWGGPGSSGDPCSDTYRGPSAGSEPEVQALMNFMIAHRFVTEDSYHSHGGMVLYPWGYTTDPAPDEPLLDAMAAEMTSGNGYLYGQPGEILYLVSGDTIDWSYGETQLKPRIFAFTTETGGGDFWPDPWLIEPVVAENIPANLYLMEQAGPVIVLLALEVVGGDGNGRLDPGETADLVPALENTALLAGAEGVTAILASDDPYLLLNDAVSAVGSLGPGETFEGWGDPFGVTVDPATPEGHELHLTVRLVGSPGIDTELERTLTVGEPPFLYATDFESDDGGWTQDPMHDAATGAFERIDPNPTEYQPGEDTTPPPGIYAWVTAQNTSLGHDDVDEGVSATRSPIIDLSGVPEATLRLNYFFGQRDTGDDPEGDYFRIELSNDGGATYPVVLVSFGDSRHEAVWTPLEVDLASVIPLTSAMRLRVLASDGPAQGDIVEAGLDDIQILADDGNDPPTAPVLLAPPDGAEGLEDPPTLTAGGAVDPEGDPLSYGFQVFADSLLTQLVASADGVPEAGGEASWTPPALGSGTFWWRSYASDGSEWGPASSPWRFTIGPASAAGEPGAPVALWLGRPSPNPLRRGTSLPLYVPRPGRLVAEVLDVAGRRVARLRDGTVPAGWTSLRWDGRDEEGRRVASGLYWIRVRWAGETTATRVLIVE
jgi:hypothetical protein